jgi:hypothetical protein
MKMNHEWVFIKRLEEGLAVDSDWVVWKCEKCKTKVTTLSHIVPKDFIWVRPCNRVIMENALI